MPESIYIVAPPGGDTRMGSGIPAATSLISTLGSNIGIRQDFMWLPSTLSAGGVTVVNQIAADAPFSAVQLIYLNYDTNSPMSILNATVAPSSAMGENGSALTWTPVTFSSGNVLDLPPTYYATTAGFSVPAGKGSLGGSGVQSFVGWAASDWMPISSIARTDGGSLPLVQIRTCFPNNGAIVHVEPGLGAFETSAAPKYWFTAWVGSDPTGVYVTAPTTNTMTPVSSTSVNIIAPQIVRFAYTGVTGLSVMTAGDSITRGQTTDNITDLTLSWGQYACSALSTQSRPVTLANIGSSGQDREASYRYAVWAIQNLQPDVLVFWNGSINDGVTDYVINRNWNHTIQLINMCKANGIIPVVVTQTPNSGMTLTQDAFRVAMNNRTRALSGNGVYVLDADGIITDGGSPAHIQSGYVSGSAGVHPSVAGYQAIGTGFQAILSTILAGR